MGRKRKPRVHIKCYGLFWNPDYVDWENGQMKGKRMTGSNTQPKRGPFVDFWKQTAIYALYFDDDLIYVGQVGQKRKKQKKAGRPKKNISTRDLGTRLFEHLSDEFSGRWNKFSWFGFAAVSSKHELDEVDKINVEPKDELHLLEALSISLASRLISNKQDGGWNSLHVPRFVQAREDSVIKKNVPDPFSIDKRLSSLETNLNKIMSSVGANTHKGPKTTGLYKVVTETNKSLITLNKKLKK
jgi:hypothetical protein